jgi:hypothetical protein
MIYLTYSSKSIYFTFLGIAVKNLTFVFIIPDNQKGIRNKSKDQSKDTAVNPDKPFPTYIITDTLYGQVICLFIDHQGYYIKLLLCLFKLTQELVQKIDITN